MKLKALTLALFAAGLLTGLTLIAPATGADPPTTTSGSTTSGTTTVATPTTTPTTTTTSTTTTAPTTTTPTTTPTTTTPTNYTNATDPISALSSTSITVGPLTCSIGSSSPGTGDFKVGDRVRMYCSNGVLIYIRADTPTTTTTTTTPAPTTTTTPTTTTSTNYTSATDAITALSSTSITVGQLTCSIGSSSPHTGDFKIGDRVRIYCASGVLAYLIRPDAPTTTPTTTPSTTATTTTTTTIPTSDHGDEHHNDVMTTRLGTISALNSTSITVDGLTCTIGSSSPSLSAFKLGDQVGIGCVNGVLAKIGTPQVNDGGFKVVVQLGSIMALDTASITVGNLTCSLATTSPSVASYKVGDRVGVGCAGGILFMIGALPNTDSVSKTEIRHALVERFKGCIKHGSEKCTVNGILHRLVHK